METLRQPVGRQLLANEATAFLIATKVRRCSTSHALPLHPWSLCLWRVCALLSTQVAHAQTFPSRPLRLVVPFPPGAGTDAFARVIAVRLSESLGRPVIVENKAGGGATVGTNFVAKAVPDGYTMLLSTASHGINSAVFSKLPYDTLKDFATVTQVANLPIVLVVHPSVPVTSLRELVALAKAKPGTLNMGSAGNGTVFHRLLQGPQPHPGLSECDLHILGLPVSAAKGADKVRARLYQLLASR